MDVNVHIGHIFYTVGIAIRLGCIVCKSLMQLKLSFRTKVWRFPFYIRLFKDSYCLDQTLTNILVLYYMENGRQSEGCNRSRRIGQYIEWRIEFGDRWQRRLSVVHKIAIELARRDAFGYLIRNGKNNAAQSELQRGPFCRQT